MATKKISSTKKADAKSGDNPHAKFYGLLSLISYESKESLVYQYSGQLSLRWIYKNSRQAYDRMVSDLERETSTPEFKEMNLLRKRVIASVGGYFAKVKRYQNISYAERLKVIKATAIQSTGTDKGFNQLTRQQLITTYSVFNDKQKTIERVDMITLLDGVNSN